MKSLRTQLNYLYDFRARIVLRHPSTRHCCLDGACLLQHTDLGILNDFQIVFYMFETIKKTILFSSLLLFGGDSGLK